jgi:predicted transcriptional regulator
MSLKGEIENFQLPSVLQLLSADKKSGLLTIDDGKRKVQVFIKAGNIVYAVGTQKEVRLGYLLRTKGIISAEELNKALALAKQRKERLGKILVERGFISGETLKKFIHQQVREILYDLFLWKNGAFEYVDQEINLGDELTTELNYMEVILEGTRRVDEWSILRKNIPHPQIVFRINKDLEQQDETVDLTANEWRIISLVDGERSVQQIIADSGHDEFTVYRMINSLISSGLIEKSESGTRAFAGGGDENPIIIVIYHEVLQRMLKLLEKAVGKRAPDILEEAKAQLPDHQAVLLRSYDCRGGAKSNVQLILQSAGDSPPSTEALLNAFNGWILAILHKQKEVLNEQAMAANIQNLTTPSSTWQKLAGKSDLKGTILRTIIQTVEQFQQEVVKKEPEKEKSGGILGFLKKK